MMKRVMISALLGLLAPVVFTLGAEPFEVIGRTSWLEISGGCMAVLLYLGLAQFLVSPKGQPGLGGKGPTMIAMLGAVAVTVATIAVLERIDTLVSQGIPLLLAGCLGTIAGAFGAGRKSAT
jgi:hypothetical protein